MTTRVFTAESSLDVVAELCGLRDLSGDSRPLFFSQPAEGMHFHQPAAHFFYGSSPYTLVDRFEHKQR